MDINDLKKSWATLNHDDLDKGQLQKMIRVKNHPTLQKLRIKLLTEIILLTLFLFIYYDALDGNKKPVYINLLLISGILLFIINNAIGYLFVKKMIYLPNIVSSIQRQIVILNRMFALSIISSVFYSVTLLLFLTVSIDFTNTKYFILIGILLAFSVMFFVSFKTWNARINHFRQLLADFKNYT